MCQRLRMRKGLPPQNCVENVTSEAEFSAKEDLSFYKYIKLILYNVGPIHLFGVLYLM